MWRLNSRLMKSLVFKGKKCFSTTSVIKKRHCCKLLVVGGGCAGCCISAKFAKILNKNEIIIVEPADVHFYQPYFTFIGAGVKKLRDCVRTTIEVMSPEVAWLQDSAKIFCPHINTIITKNDDIIEYEFMIIAVGIDLELDQVKGLREALSNYRNVCTIFSRKYAEKTFKCLKEFVSGNALFTAPKTPIKCSAAAFKICFIAEDYFKREDKLFETDVTYTTGMKNIFPVKKYAKTILEIAKRKRVDIHLETNLVEVIPDRNKAVFECLSNPGATISMDYNMLHVAPPMAIPKDVRECKELVNNFKFVDVDLNTLQHNKYPNIFALGDCSPGTSNKTASAISNQSLVVFKNLSNVMCGKKPEFLYDGYTACPVVTGYGTCFLVEFNYKMEICESFPFNQNVETRTMYYMKKDIMPHIYWQCMLKGLYSGSTRLQSIMKALRLK